MKSFGTQAEGKYVGASYEDFKVIQSTGKFEELSYGEKLTETINVDGRLQSLSICYYEAKAAEWSFAELQTGGWPDKAQDMVVSEGFCKAVENVAVGEELYLESLGKSFLVCGISQDDGISVYISKEDWEDLGLEKKANGEIFVRFSISDGSEEWLQKISEETFERPLLGLVNPALVYNSKEGLFYTRIATLVLFFVITFLVIYSAYYFAMVKDLKIYASLRLLGVKSDQLQTVVKYQAFRQYLLGAPLGVLFAFLFNKIALLVMNKVAGTDLLVKQSLSDYLLTCTITFLAVLIGLNKPIRMMSKMSGIQAYRYQSVNKIKRKRTKAQKFSGRVMAWRTVRRNWERAMLVGISMALVLIVFVVNVNLIHSIIRYDDYLYASEYDFVVASEHRLFFLSKCQGIEQPENPHHMDGWAFDDAGEFIDKVDKGIACELKQRLPQDEFTCYFSLDAAIDDSEYADRVKEAIAQKILGEDQSFFYTLSWDYLGFYSQQQYYVDFSELEKCKLVEGTLNRDLFETGKYAVLIFDKELEADTLYHVGDKMIVGGYPEHDASKSIMVNGEEPAEVMDTIRESQQEVEVMAVVEKTSEMYFITGNNACFLSVNGADVWTDKDIMLYGITIDSQDIETTEAAVRAVIGTPEVDAEHYTAYLSDATKTKQKQDDVFMYKVLCAGVGGILCVMAFINLLNNAMLGLIERKKELSTLHAIGMKKSQIIGMLRAENLIIVGGGSMLGYVLGMLFSKAYMLAAHGEYVGFSDYISYNWWPGLLFVAGVMLFSCVYPNQSTNISFKRGDGL